MKAIVLGVFAAVALAGSAAAAEIEVKMLDKGTEGVMVFEPSLVKIAPGDTVKFVPTNKSHNAETINGMLPEGAKPFVGKVNQEVDRHVRSAGRLRRQVPAALRHGHGRADRGRNAGQCDGGEGGDASWPARQVFANLFGRLRRTERPPSKAAREATMAPHPASARRIAGPRSVLTAFAPSSCSARSTRRLRC